MQPSPPGDDRPTDEIDDSAAATRDSASSSSGTEAPDVSAPAMSDGTHDVDDGNDRSARHNGESLGVDETPETPAPTTVEREEVQVRARLAPRYGRFMALGALLGFGGGFLWSRLGGNGRFLGVGPVVDTSVVVPFLMIVGAVVGMVLGALVAVVLDRIVGRRRRIAYAERTRRHRD